MSCSYRYFRRQSVEAPKQLTDNFKLQNLDHAGPAPALRFLPKAILSLTIPVLLLSGGPAYAEDAPAKEKVVEATTKDKKRLSSAKELGLDSANLNLVNHGAFKELAEKLKTQSGKHGTRDTAWLAFAYMFIGDCASLDSLAKSFVQTSGDVNATLIQAFDLVCKKKLDEAEKKLQSIPASSMNDPFVNFAFAALAGKQGKPSVAITYTERATALAPDFAWGYRTVGF